MDLRVPCEFLDKDTKQPVRGICLAINEDMLAVIAVGSQLTSRRYSEIKVFLNYTDLEKSWLSHSPNVANVADHIEPAPEL